MKKNLSFVILLVLVAACIFASNYSSLAAANSRPNFLFIYTDDQRWDALSVVQREQGERARFPWFQTPNLDRLAGQGVRFRNAFVVNSLCSPSRACFLTSRYSHLNGIANNHTPFATNSVTHASLLRAAGYTSGYIGKWHMDNQRGQRPGFDYSASFIAHARYLDAPFEINGEPTPTRGWVDDVSTDYAISFLRKYKEKPWLLVVGYKSPHGPFEPPERLKNRFEGAMAKVPPNANNVPPFPRGTKKSPAVPGTLGTTTVNLNYFRCIAGVDENVGRLIQTLDELGLAENTMVVYASDNGFYLGEHGLGDKRSAYDESMRIPLIVRYPKLAAKGKIVDELALNIDLAPTFLDFAGVPVPQEMQGRSWRPLLEGKPAEWRKAFFYEYFYEQNFFTPTVTAVRTDTAKLIKYPGHEEWTELFDLKGDPYETHNLVGIPGRKALLEQMQAEYGRQATAVGFKIPDYADNPKEAAPPAQRLNAFVLDYSFVKDEGDRVMDSSGHGNHGTARDAPVVPGREGTKARRFDGQGWIDVPKSTTLNCSAGPWTVEAVVKVEQPDGVILARGGRSQGYALHIEEGRPVFSVRANQRVTSVAGKLPVTGQWVHLAGVITADQHLALYLNGTAVARSTLPDFIASDPYDAMQIGADNASTVAEYKHPSKFVGWVESVRLFSGERNDKDIQGDAQGILK